MKIHRYLLTLCMLASACASTSAGAARPVTPSAATERRPTPAALGQWIDAYVSAFGRSWGPAFAFTGYVGVARDGQWVYNKAFGKADFARDGLLFTKRRNVSLTFDPAGMLVKQGPLTVCYQHSR